MDIREKLVELLKRDPCPSTYLCDRNCNYADLERCFEERFADHLIANGVTIKEPVFLTGLTTVTDTPPVEYAPVKQGRWKLHKDGSGTCDQCNFRQRNVWDYDSFQNYCGVCGAKMALEVGND